MKPALPARPLSLSRSAGARGSYESETMNVSLSATALSNALARAASTLPSEISRPMTSLTAGMRAAAMDRHPVPLPQSSPRPASSRRWSPIARSDMRLAGVGAKVPGGCRMQTSPRPPVSAPVSTV